MINDGEKSIMTVNLINREDKNAMFRYSVDHESGHGKVVLDSVKTVDLKSMPYPTHSIVAELVFEKPENIDVLIDNLYALKEQMIKRQSIKFIKKPIPR